MTTWGDLRAGDVVQARTGGLWQVTGWRDQRGPCWVSAGGGRQRVFTLAPIDNSRPPITAPHVLSDPVSRVFQYDRSEVDLAAMALAAVFSTTILEESLTMGEPAACQHPEQAVSKLKGGKIVCTECFTTLHDPAELGVTPVDSAAVAIVNGGTLDNIVPPYEAVDSSGVEYMIPARDRRAACEANIHPKVSVQWEGDRLRGCGACGLVFPNYLHDVLSMGAANTSTADEIDQGYRDEAMGLPDVTAAYGDAAAVLAAAVEGLDEGAHLGPNGMVTMGADEAYVAAVEAASTAVMIPHVPPVVQVSEPPPGAGVLPLDMFSDPAGSTEVKRDRWKRYLLPDPYEGHERAWTRASTLARAMADEYNLTGWKLRMVALGIARNADLSAGILALSDINEGDDKKTARTLVDKAMERAESSVGANMGTAFHNFTHRLDRGESLASLRAPAEIETDLIEYQATLKRYGLGVVPDLVERIVVCPELGAAGTFDRILTQHPGPFSPFPLTVGDLKTGKSVEWSWLEWAIQLAIYANATHMWDPATQSYTPMPPRDVLDRDRALIIHLPVSKRGPDGKRLPAVGTVYGVNLIEGWEAAHLAERVRVMRNNGKGYGWSINPVNPEALLIYRVSQADGPELARLWDRHQPRGEWTDAVAHAAAERVARLQEVPL